MKGTVKFFDTIKGWGFITDESGKDVFVHYSNILMDGRKFLHENDIVEFEIGEGVNGRELAVNVQPILTIKMIEESLKSEGMYVKQMDNAKYIVVDANKTIKSSEQGMSFEELAAYAGFSVSEE